MKRYEFVLTIFQGLTALLVACCFGWCYNLVYDTYYNTDFVCIDPVSAVLGCKLIVSWLLVVGSSLFFACLFLTSDYDANIK